MKNTKKSNAEPEGFEDILTRASPEVQALSRQLRLMLKKTLPVIVEVTWVKQRISGYGIGPKKMSEQFCYIAPQKKHVNLGFYYGADLDDDSKLLKGIGKKLRHIKICSLTDLQNPALKKLLKQASHHLPLLKKTGASE